MIYAEDPSLWKIIFFLIAILVGIALVSVHYRKGYEKQKSDNIKLRDIVRRFIKIEDLKKKYATPKTM
jgi:hypothetical protein